ncbi:hypothetical protein LINPERPRIM_LOCUS25852 [Linum perenne]
MTAEQTLAFKAVAEWVYLDQVASFMVDDFGIQRSLGRGGLWGYELSFLMNKERKGMLLWESNLSSVLISVPVLRSIKAHNFLVRSGIRVGRAKPDGQMGPLTVAKSCPNGTSRAGKKTRKGWSGRVWCYGYPARPARMPSLLSFPSPFFFLFIFSSYDGSRSIARSSPGVLRQKKKKKKNSLILYNKDKFYCVNMIKVSI